MTRTEAHRLLDAARAGRDIAEELITDALGVTGDLKFPPERVHRAAGTWERCNRCDTLLMAAGPFDALTP